MIKVRVYVLALFYLTTDSSHIRSAHLTYNAQQHFEGAGLPEAKRKSLNKEWILAVR